MSPAELAAIFVVVAIALAAVVRARAGRALAFAVFLVMAIAAALWPRRAPATVRAPGVPGPSTALGYVSSAACLPCHPGEHASFSRTWHRTMTQAATPQAILAPAAWAQEQPIVLVTGSHREQAYWRAGEAPGTLEILPWVWLPEERALIPRSEAFIVPPGEALPRVRWASSCIACHAVAGEPHNGVDPRAAELGIACEACHGPGAAHVERHRDPVARYVQHASKGADPTIVHPGRISAERSVAVCGQCHAYAFPRDEAGWWREGYSRTFRAGDALAPTRLLLRPDAMNGENGAPVVDADAASIFWPDGDVRVGGREYNGFVLSRCFSKGRATCLSCHAMHDGDPAGQIGPAKRGDAMCTQCHRDDGHAKHPPTSKVACVDCHMPKTSYALLQGVRSHRIAVPRRSAGKPSACDLCHLDRDGAWSAGLTGDAGVRALVADALGRAPVAEMFAIPILDAMIDDPYAAVRFIARRSRRRFAGTAPALAPDVLASLRAARDDRPMTIAE